MRDDQDIDKIAADMRECFRTAGQEHVFTFWDHLENPARRRLLEQLREIDLDVLAEPTNIELARAGEDKGELLPAPALRLGKEPEEGSRREGRNRGEELLGAGKIALLLVAGGRGSRLGQDGPKGCFPLAPLSAKSLFEIHAAKIRRLALVHDVSIPWYIMTSASTDARTREYFEQKDFLGLPPADIIFMKQGSLPVLDRRGKLILEAPDRISLSPNGHGGCYEALRDSGALEDARSRGIAHIFYFQVDNPLVSIADPLFCGLHDLTGSDMSLKVLKKTGPGEKIGVVAMRDDAVRVVEYTDLPREQANLRDSAGDLVFALGSIGIHLLRREFIEKLLSASTPLPLHPVSKRLDAIDGDGEPVTIEGTQLETFVFDALSLARRSFNLEVRREREFAPAKVLEGVDSVDSARKLLVEEHRRWLARAGITAHGTVEIDPLAGGSAEELAGELGPWSGREFKGSLLVSRGEDGKLSLEEPAGREHLS